MIEKGAKFDKILLRCIELVAILIIIITNNNNIIIII